MDKKQIRKDLDKMTDGFCQTFNRCAEDIIKNSSKIPKQYRKKESQYIGRQCIQKVAKAAK